MLQAKHHPSQWGTGQPINEPPFHALACKVMVNAHGTIAYESTTVQVDSLPLLIPHFLLLRLLLRALLPFDCGMGSSVASCISAPPSDWMVRCASMYTIRSRTCKHVSTAHHILAAPSWWACSYHNHLTPEISAAGCCPGGPDENAIQTVSAAEHDRSVTGAHKHKPMTAVSNLHMSPHRQCTLE
jgi:hypothetical protein